MSKRWRRRIGGDPVVRGVRNGESRRCSLTSGAAHHNPENITPCDLQFGWLRPTVSLSLHPSLTLVSPRRIPATGSLLLSMKRKHRREIRPGHGDAENPESRLTRNKNAVNFHFPPRTSRRVIVRYIVVFVSVRLSAHPRASKRRTPGRGDKFPKTLHPRRYVPSGYSLG